MSKAAKPSVPALDRSPSHLLHRALQLALDIYADEAGDEAVTQRQFAVLAAVQAHATPTQTDLVRATGIDRSTLADMIARMTAKGVLARERSATDARANVVRLTDDGRAALDLARPRVAAADLRILSALGAGKRDPFIAALRGLARAGETVLLTGDPAQLKAKAPKAGKADKPIKADKSEKKKKRKAEKRAKAVSDPPSSAPEA